MSYFASFTVFNSNRSSLFNTIFSPPILCSKYFVRVHITGSLHLFPFLLFEISFSLGFPRFLCCPHPGALLSVFVSLCVSRVGGNLQEMSVHIGILKQGFPSRVACRIGYTASTLNDV